MPAYLAQNTLSPASQWAVVLGALAISAVFAGFAGVFRRGSVLGPRRLIPEQPLWPLVLCGIIAAVFWMGISGVYVSQRASAFVRAHPNAHFDPRKDLRGHDFAFLALAPDLVAMGVLLLLNILIDPRIARAIAPLPRKLPRAIGAGVLGILAVFPLLLACGVVLDAFYKTVGYQHPSAHELLAAMKETLSPLTRALLVLGACVIAPIFEEYLFRGHLQTFLVRRLDPPPRFPAGQGPLPVMARPESEVIDYAAPRPIPDRRSLSRTWLAIFITSIVFAGFHPVWMAPLIFVLSLCLGYAYERTGNIWVAIIIHALFNTLNTVQFLFLM
jgi:membrane protease YdiL (CAAX protease family)